MLVQSGGQSMTSQRAVRVHMARLLLLQMKRETKMTHAEITPISDFITKGWRSASLGARSLLVELMVLWWDKLVTCFH